MALALWRSCASALMCYRSAQHPCTGGKPWHCSAPYCGQHNEGQGEERGAPKFVVPPVALAVDRQQEANNGRGRDDPLGQDPLVSIHLVVRVVLVVTNGCMCVGGQEGAPRVRRERGRKWAGTGGAVCGRVGSSWTGRGGPEVTGSRKRKPNKKKLTPKQHEQAQAARQPRAQQPLCNLAKGIARGRLQNDSHLDKRVKAAQVMQGWMHVTLQTASPVDGSKTTATWKTG